MNEITISSAEITFVAAGLLIAISLVVLNFAWKSLIQMVSSLPEGQRRVIRNIRVIKDEREKDKATFIMVHFAGCTCFIASIALAVASMGGVVSEMLGYRLGFYQPENFEFGRFYLWVSVSFFTIGFGALALSYLDKLISLVTGKPELLTTDLTTLPRLTVSQIAERSKIEKSFAVFFVLFLILLFTLEVFNPFGTWLKFLVALGATALFLLLTVGTRRIRGRRPKS